MDNAFSSKYCCVWLITMPKSALTYHRHYSNRNRSPVRTAPVKEFKTVNNSISRVIRVLIDKQRIPFSEVWDRVDHRTNTKTRGSKYKNALCTSKHMYKQTNIPDFQLCYPCKCLARYARSPIRKEDHLLHLMTNILS